MTRTVRLRTISPHEWTFPPMKSSPRTSSRTSRSTSTTENLLLLVQKFPQTLVHTPTPWKRDGVCRTSQWFACLSSLLDCERTNRERRALTLSRGSIPLMRFSGRGNVGFFHGLLDLSHDQWRPVVWSTRITFGRCGSNAGTLPWLLALPCPYEGRAPKRPRDSVSLA